MIKKKLNVRETKTSEKNKANEDNLQTILEQNKHDYINKDPKTKKIMIKLHK